MEIDGSLTMASTMLSRDWEEEPLELGDLVFLHPEILDLEKLIAIWDFVFMWQ